MKQKQIVTGVVGIVIGFVLGFFVARLGGTDPLGTRNTQAANRGEVAGGLPENHPSPDVMQQIVQMQQMAEQDAENRQVRVALGNLFYDMGQFDAAIPWYEEALTLESSDVAVTTDLGTAYLSTGDFDKAIQLYQRSLRMEENHPQTLQNIGIAYYSSERFEEAVRYWQKLVDTYPDYPHAEEVRQHIETAKHRLESH